MGSGDWFKTIVRLKKPKDGRSKKAKGSSVSAKSKNHLWKQSLGKPTEDIAATRIQTAFRAYVARRTLRRLKGAVRLQVLTQAYSVKRQATTTLSHLHTWSNIQSHIRARRLCMVTEGRLRQKKLENQIKLEAKLHDLEVEWCGGPETMEIVLARIHQKEDAAVKRERAMAYAFSHQDMIDKLHAMNEVYLTNKSPIQTCSNVAIPTADTTACTSSKKVLSPLIVRGKCRPPSLRKASIMEKVCKPKTRKATQKGKHRQMHGRDIEVVDTRRNLFGETLVGTQESVPIQPRGNISEIFDSSGT